MHIDRRPVGSERVGDGAGDLCGLAVSGFEYDENAGHEILYWLTPRCIRSVTIEPDLEELASLLLCNEKVASAIPAIGRA